MTDQGHNLVSFHVDRNSLENGDIFFRRVGELDVLELDFSSGSILTTWALISIKLDFVGCNHKNGHLIGRARDFGDGLDVVGD